LAYFDRPENVNKYIEMSEGYDGRELIKVLFDHLPRQSTLLELGMGPGKDLLILSKKFQVTGSDSSQVFVDRFVKTNPNMNVLCLDAVSIETEMRFDCIYSNKVLHHLAHDDLVKSLDRQFEVLANGGIAMHSFWYGEKEEFYDDLRFMYYTEDTILDLVQEKYDIVAVERYTEFDKDDSFFIVIKKSGKSE